MSARIPPKHAQTLLDMLDWHVEHHPDHPHVRLCDEGGVDSGVISYRALYDAAMRIAAQLQLRDVAQGDAIALMLPTGADYFYSFFGVLYAGAVPVPIYPPARMTQLEDHVRRQANILDNAQARFLITVPQARSIGRLLRARAGSLKGVLTVDELHGDADYSRPYPGAGDTAFLQYTSGSTGNPKGVILSHHNLLSNIRADGQAIDATGSDVFVSWLPLYHDMGLIGAWLGSLYFGAQLVVMSPLTFLARPVRWLQALHRFGGTLSAAPNFAYELCLTRIADDELHGLDLSRWRIAFNGAEAVSPETIERFRDRFAPYGFRDDAMFPVYGLAENSVGLAFPDPGRAPRIERIRRDVFSRDGRAQPAGAADGHALRFVGCGHALPGHEIRIVDSAGHQLPERREGRLQFRGPSATSGYFRNPDATARLFDRGWLESGDLAYQADGDLFITGRSKDVIVRGGRNIYPQEIEEAIGEINGIRKGRVAAFASLDRARQTERLVVLAETHESGVDAREILQQQIIETTSALTMTPPDDIVLAPPGTVLKTSSGKIRRAACRELYEQGRVGTGQPAAWRQLLRMALGALPGQLRRIGHRIGDTAYALYAQAVFRALALWVTVVVLTVPKAEWRWGSLGSTARAFARLTGTGLTVHGMERLPAPGQPCVFVVNHASYIDSYVMRAAIPRRYRFVAKAELANDRLARIFLRRIGTLFVERFDAAKGVAAMRETVDAARNGDSLLYYPEGTFTRAPGLRPFHMGAFVTAVAGRVPLVPVALRGTRAILPGRDWFARHGHVVVTVGDPVYPEQWRQPGETDWDLALRLKEQVRLQILLHCGEPDRGNEPVAPPRRG